MYRHYPNSHGDGSFSKEEIQHGYIALHTDYECHYCGKAQSVASMGGYGGNCITCGQSSDPSKNIKQELIMEKLITENTDFDIYMLEGTIENAINYLNTINQEFKSKGCQNPTINISIDCGGSNDSYIQYGRPETAKERQLRLNKVKQEKQRKLDNKKNKIEKLIKELNNAGYDVTAKEGVRICGNGCTIVG